MHLHLTFSGLVCILSLQGRQEQGHFTTRLRVLKLIHSWYSSENGRDDFVVAGTKTLRYLLRRQCNLPLASDEHHLVTYPRLLYLRLLGRCEGKLTALEAL